MPLWIILLITAPAVGSFLGGLINRSEHTKLMGRSHCDACGHVLAWFDLLPIVSWFMLKRRCRYCQATLTLFYPVIELSAAIVVLWAATVTSGEHLIVSVFLGWLLVLLSSIDWHIQRLPDSYTFSLITLGLVTGALFNRVSMTDAAIGGLAGFFFFALVGYIYAAIRHRPGLGLGDAKLLAGLGTFVTWRGLPSVVFLAAVLGLLFAGCRAILHRGDKGERIAFGPFLALAGWMVWLYGPLLPLG